MIKVCFATCLLFLPYAQDMAVMFSGEVVTAYVTDKTEKASEL